MKMNLKELILNKEPDWGIDVPQEVQEALDKLIRARRKTQGRSKAPIRQRSLFHQKKSFLSLWRAAQEARRIKLNPGWGEFA